jgi:tetratricopeptide (TPR) repeat protein
VSDSTVGVGQMLRFGRVNTSWDLLRESSDAGRRARRRLVATGGLTLLLSGLLTAIGLAIVVIAVVGLVLIALAVSATASAFPTYWPRARARARAASVRLRKLVTLALVQTRHGGRAARRAVTIALATLRVRGGAVARAGIRDGSRQTRRLTTRARTGAATLRAQARPRVQAGRERIERARLETLEPQLQRRALKLNAAGTRHRREGAHEQAAELHRHALRILQRLGDQRAIALTENNLALALSHGGEDEEAIALFEHAAATLGELGDEEHEGRIMANLGLVYRRLGHDEESSNVLQFALTKLPPESEAYETIEAQLRPTG